MASRISVRQKLTQILYPLEYVLKNVPTSNYNLVISKDGFGTNKQFDFQFIGDATTYYVEKDTYLYKQSTTACEITTISVTHNNLTQRNELTTSCTVSPAGTQQFPRGVILFIDTVNTVSPSRYFFTNRSSYVPTTTGSLNAYISDGSWFKSGKMIYVVAYGATPAIVNLYYFDPAQRINIFPNLNPNHSTVYSFKIP